MGIESIDVRIFKQIVYCHFALHRDGTDRPADEILPRKRGSFLVKRFYVQLRVFFLSGAFSLSSTSKPKLSLPVYLVLLSAKLHN